LRGFLVCKGSRWPQISKFRKATEPGDLGGKLSAATAKPRKLRPTASERQNRKEASMPKNLSFISMIAALSALSLPGPAQAQSTTPNLAGTYRCVPEPSSCQWQEQNPTISQTGATLQLNINKDEFAEGKLTSNITLGPARLSMHSIEPALSPGGQAKDRANTNAGIAA
jgi:hypothetical protein